MNILSSPVITTAVAIVISWAFFAIFCSILHEAVAQLKAERGRFMRKYLFKQLQDLPNGVNWASLLYLHGTVNLLSREANKPTNEIQSDVFAKTLIEIVGNVHLVQMQLPLLEQNLLSAKEKNKDKDYQSAQFVNAAQNYFSHALLFNFKAATQLLKPSAVVSMLSQAIHVAELNANAGSKDQWVTEASIYTHLTAVIEKWYTDFTGRVTLWYKKKTRQRLFLLGCVLGLFLNIDSLQLFSFYTANPAARDALINYYQQNADTLSGLAGRLQYSNGRSANLDSLMAVKAPSIGAGGMLYIDSTIKSLRKRDTVAAPDVEILDNAAARAREDSAAAGHTNSQSRTTDSSNNKPLASSPDKVADTLQLLSRGFLHQVDSLRSTANLPVGFHYSLFKTDFSFFSYAMLLKIIGILISGIAASFGGPFWFDLLRKIYTRR